MSEQIGWKSLRTEIRQDWAQVGRVKLQQILPSQLCFSESELTEICCAFWDCGQPEKALQLIIASGHEQILCQQNHPLYFQIILGLGDITRLKLWVLSNPEHPAAILLAQLKKQDILLNFADQQKVLIDFVSLFQNSCAIKIDVQKEDKVQLFWRCYSAADRKQRSLWTEELEDRFDDFWQQVGKPPGIWMNHITVAVREMDEAAPDWRRFDP